jgi:hypothetical protein
LQDYFFAIPSDRRVENHGPNDDTFCGRVVQFFSADIVGLASEGRTDAHDLALVEWLCEYETPKGLIRPTESWTGVRMCYEPHKPWTDIVDVARILGPEPVVPYSRWPTIPYSEAKWKASRFPHGRADSAGKLGSGSRMYVRQTMLRRLARVLPERIPGAARGSQSGTGGGLSEGSESAGGETDDD